jgi:hypothetical protein
VTWCIPLHPELKTSTHYFSCSGGPGAVSIKSTERHVTSSLCFYIRWDLRVIDCILGSLGREMSVHYFSCSGGPDVVSPKSASTHVTPNLCFASGGIYGSRSCSHKNLTACVELGRTLFCKVSTDAFLFKATKGS